MDGIDVFGTFVPGARVGIKFVGNTGVLGTLFCAVRHDYFSILLMIKCLMNWVVCFVSKNYEVVM